MGTIGYVFMLIMLMALITSSGIGKGRGHLVQWKHSARRIDRGGPGGARQRGQGHQLLESSYDPSEYDNDDGGDGNDDDGSGDGHLLINII